MSIQQLLAQLQGMGLGATGFGSSGQDVGGALAGQYFDESLTTSPLTSEMFQTINPQLLKSASMGAYSPMFQQKQGSMTGGLMQQLQAKPLKQAYGGFAGSGGAQHAEQQARDVYGQGMQDVLTQAMSSKTQSLGTIQDIINQWQETAQSFTGA